MPLSKDVDLKELAGLTHGYVGADLAALSKEAAMRSLRRILPDIDLQADVIPPEILNRLTVTRDDFLAAYREMEPSTLREVLIEKPNVKWEDIGCLGEAQGPRRPRAPPSGPLRPTHLHRAAGSRDAQGDPPNPHASKAARQGGRPRRCRSADGQIHRCGTRRRVQRGGDARDPGDRHEVSGPR